MVKEDSIMYRWFMSRITGQTVLRSDLRLGKHLCAYRKFPHQVQGGCGCLCDLCELEEAGKLPSEGDAPLPIEQTGD